MDTLKIFETYVQVVKAESFAAAADQLGISRAMVTKHVMQLERRLGARLLNRTTRRFGVTDIGREYFEFCVRFLEQLKSEEALIASRQNEPRGTLRILSPKSFGSLHLADAALDFMKLNPDVRISLVLTDVSIPSVDLVDGGFDMAVRLSRQRDSERVMRRVAVAEWVTCASPGYLKAHGEPKNPQDLEKHNCLMHTRRADWVWRPMKSRGALPKVSGNFSSNSVIALREAALRGIGVVQLPTYCIGHDLAKGTLKAILTNYPPPAEGIYVVFPHSELLPAKSRLFIEFLVKRFRTPAWQKS